MGKGRKKKMSRTVQADKRKRVILIAAVSAVVLVVAGGAGWFVWSKHELSVAQADCVRAAQILEDMKAKYAKLVDGDAKTASAVTAEQVKDTKTVETLAGELKASEPKSVACPAKDTKGLKDATAKLNTQVDWYETHRASLSKAMENVTASKLDKVIDVANGLLNDSDGKVADNTTRDELAKAIEAKDEKAIAEATTKVNDSIAAKAQADSGENSNTGGVADNTVSGSSKTGDVNGDGKYTSADLIGVYICANGEVVTGFDPQSTAPVTVSKDAKITVEGLPSGWTTAPIAKQNGTGITIRMISPDNEHVIVYTLNY